jgi:hypothetical protein
MKRLILTFIFCSSLSYHQPVNAQCCTESSKPKMGVIPKSSVLVDAQLLDVNNIECYLSNNGIFAENPYTNSNGFFYPQGQRERSLIFTSGFFVVGKLNGELRTAAVQYSTEFQPGPILPDGTPSDPEDPQNKIYKYNKGDVIDQEALDQGCPDEVLGDMMLFCVFNDFADHAGVFTLPPIGIEVRLTAYAFNRTGALGNTVFLQYEIVNKNAEGHTLEDAYVGMFYDNDLGNGGDDAIGCDPSLDLAYAYNATNYDQVYQVGPPAFGSVVLQGPLVYAPGETAILPGGIEIPNKSICGMAAMGPYI